MKISVSGVSSLGPPKRSREGGWFKSLKEIWLSLASDSARTLISMKDDLKPSSPSRTNKPKNLTGGNGANGDRKEKTLFSSARSRPVGVSSCFKDPRIFAFENK